MLHSLITLKFFLLTIFPSSKSPLQSIRPSHLILPSLSYSHLKSRGVHVLSENNHVHETIQALNLFYINNSINTTRNLKS